MFYPSFTNIGRALERPAWRPPPRRGVAGPNSRPALRSESLVSCPVSFLASCPMSFLQRTPKRTHQRTRERTLRLLQSLVTRAAAAPRSSTRRPGARLHWRRCAATISAKAVIRQHHSLMRVGNLNRQAGCGRRISPSFAALALSVELEQVRAWHIERVPTSRNGHCPIRRSGGVPTSP